jgi:hypothetical protein
LLVLSELEKRRGELDKVNTLDDKIAKELQTLKERMESMNAEMKTFKSSDELKAESEQAKKVCISSFSFV